MQHLSVKRFSAHGAYLSDDDGAEVLLPKRYLTDNMVAGALVWVFIYTDSSDRLVAVTSTPKACLGDIAALEIKGISNNGIYLDIGLPKDIFMPAKNPKRFSIAQKVVVKIALDKQSRLIAKYNVAQFLKPLRQDSGLKYVKVLPFMKTNIGMNCIVEGKYFGVIHNNDINRRIDIGTTLNAAIKNIRNDGKIDLSLQSCAKDVKENIVRILRENGTLDIHFHSSSEEIYKILGVSKKTFKTAINALVKENKITFYPKECCFKML